MRSWGDGTILIIICLFILIVVGIMLYLGFLYGKEDEKERWHKILLKDVKRKKSLKWTATINIVFLKKKDREPKISIAVGSVKSSTSNSEDPLVK